jgi:hypothetical protein
MFPFTVVIIYGDMDKNMKILRQKLYYLLKLSIKGVNVPLIKFEKRHFRIKDRIQSEKVVNDLVN